MSFVASLLGGAKSRLLPMSVPFRFFAAAAFFHVLMWACILVAAGEFVGFRGGPGPSLAAVHLLTLGVLTTTAVGASAQLLPVATRRSLVAVWPIKLVFWLLVPGLLVLLAGMYAAQTAILIAGSILVAAALALFAMLFADNLRRASSLPAVAAYGWTALAALAALAALGVLLGLDYRHAVLPDHSSAALAHAILGGYGFMGMLAAGFSYVLVPMFALSRSADTPRALATLAFALAALLLGGAGALANSHLALNAAVAAGGVATAIHLFSMRHILASGMRKRLGLSFVLVRIAWAMLPASLLAGLAALHGLAGPNGPTLFGFLLLFGWLLTFLLGILQRIMPFLASMHATRDTSAPPPLLSELAAAGPLKLHAVCHMIAIAAIAAGIGFDQVWGVRLGATAGLAGALAFAAFTAGIIRRTIRPAR